MTAVDQRPRLGLVANWRQFTLLVVVNAFVGAMVGMERTVVPLLAEEDFGIGDALVPRRLRDRQGGDESGRRAFLRPLRSEAAVGRGWVAALPVAPMIIWAPNWGFVVAANVFLGVNQGLTWSTTVIMKIDLAGPRRRGLALGLNEAAGYGAVALAAFVTGVLASRYGPRPAPSLLGIAIAITGLVLSAAFVRETRGHVSE
jgi:MFS family permease